MVNKLSILLFVFVAFGCKYNNADDTPKQPFNCNEQPVTYTGSVKAILNQYCASVGCHSGINPSGIMLDTYETAKLDFESGNSMCSLTHNTPCKPMPYPIGTPKLNDSIIAVLNCWHDNGFPN